MVDGTGLIEEVAAAAEGVFPYQRSQGRYGSVWQEAVEAREQCSAERASQLDAYAAAIDELARYQEAIQERADVLAWGLPDLVEETERGYRVVLSRHPTRDRVVIYDPVDRFVERFEDGMREAISPRALRSRMRGKSMGKQWRYRYYLDGWDDRCPGWEQVVWAWLQTEDIPTLLHERRETVEEIIQEARVVQEYIQRDGLL